MFCTKEDYAFDELHLYKFALQISLMMKNLVLAIVITFLFSSCYTTLNVAGTGASKSTVVEKKQWYALWGLVRLNRVDPKKMAGDAANYTVKTEFTFKDFCANIFNSIVSLESKTVTVIK